MISVFSRNSVLGLTPTPSPTPTPTVTPSSTVPLFSSYDFYTAYSTDGINYSSIPSTLSANQSICATNYQSVTRKATQAIGLGVRLYTTDEVNTVQNANTLYAPNHPYDQGDVVYFVQTDSLGYIITYTQFTTCVGVITPTPTTSPTSTPTPTVTPSSSSVVEFTTTLNVTAIQGFASPLTGLTLWYAFVPDPYTNIQPYDQSLNWVNAGTYNSINDCTQGGTYTSNPLSIDVTGTPFEFYGVVLHFRNSDGTAIYGMRNDALCNWSWNNTYSFYSLTQVLNYDRTITVQHKIFSNTSAISVTPTPTQTVTPTPTITPTPSPTMSFRTPVFESYQLTAYSPNDTTLIPNICDSNLGNRLYAGVAFDGFLGGRLKYYDVDNNFNLVTETGFTLTTATNWSPYIAQNFYDDVHNLHIVVYVKNSSTISITKYDLTSSGYTRTFADFSSDSNIANPSITIAKNLGLVFVSKRNSQGRYWIYDYVNMTQIHTGLLYHSGTNFQSTNSFYNPNNNLFYVGSPYINYLKITTGGTANTALTYPSDPNFVMSNYETQQNGVIDTTNNRFYFISHITYPSPSNIKHLSYIDLSTDTFVDRILTFSNSGTYYGLSVFYDEYNDYLWVTFTNSAMVAGNDNIPTTLRCYNSSTLQIVDEYQLTSYGYVTEIDPYNGYVYVSHQNDNTVGNDVDLSVFSIPNMTTTPLPTCLTPTPTQTPTVTPTPSQTVTSITLSYNYSLGSGSLNWCGKTLEQLSQATCDALVANYQVQNFYGSQISVGTQFLGTQAYSQCWVTNSNYPTQSLWNSGDTQYIIETNSSGVVTRYESFEVCPPPTPTPTATVTPTLTPTPTSFPEIIPFYQHTTNWSSVSSGQFSITTGGGSYPGTGLWSSILGFRFNRNSVLGPNNEGHYVVLPTNAGFTDNDTIMSSLGVGSTITLEGLPYDALDPQNTSVLDAQNSSITIQLTSAPYYNPNAGDPLYVTGFTITASTGTGWTQNGAYKVTFNIPTPTPTSTSTPTVTPTVSSTPTNTPTPTPTPTTTELIPFYEFTGGANTTNLGEMTVEGPSGNFPTSIDWGTIVRWKFNKNSVLGPGPEGVYGRIPYNAGVVDNSSEFQNFGAGSTITLEGIPYNPSNPSGFTAVGKSVTIQLTSPGSYDAGSSTLTISNFTITSSTGTGFTQGEEYRVTINAQQLTPTPTVTATPTVTPTNTATPTVTPTPSSSSAPLTPPTGLVIDFDASYSSGFTQTPYPAITNGDQIVQWNNLVSGQPNFSGTTATFSPATWSSSSSSFNNLGAVNFVPSQSLIAENISGLASINGYTLFIVVTTVSVSAQWILQGLDSTGSADGSLTILFTSGNFQVSTGVNNNRIVPFSTNNPTLYTVIYDGTQTGADMMVIRENGVFQSSGTNSLPSFLNSSLIGLRLGTNAGGTLGLYGQIPAVKMYNNVLTSAQITAIENQLISKFNL